MEGEVTSMTAKPLAKWQENPLVVSLVLAAVVGSGVWFARIHGALQILELRTYDWQLANRSRGLGPPPPIAIVKMTEDDIRTYGWPLTDAILANILEKIVKRGARTIGLDILRDLSVPPGHEEFNAVLRANPTIIATRKYPEGYLRDVPPPPVLNGSDRVAVNDVLVDPDGVVRRGILYLDDGVSTQSLAYALGCKLAMAYLGQTKLDFDAQGNLHWGKSVLPPFEAHDGGYVNADARGYQFVLDFRDSLRDVSSVTVTDLLEGRVPQEIFSGKIVLIGVSAPSVPDFFKIPTRTNDNNNPIIAGVELHARLTAQLVRLAQGKATPIATTSDRTEGLLVAIGAITGAMVGWFVRSPWRFSLVLATAISTLAYTAQVTLERSFWLPPLPAALALMLSALLMATAISQQEKRQRRLLMQIFQRHVSREVADVVWRQREDFLDGGRPKPQRIVATVMFTDLIDFTTVAERIDPETLLTWLNDYLEAMAGYVSQYHGIIKQYSGDSIMAIFGVPVPSRTQAEIRRDAINAVYCALGMRSALIDFNQSRHERRLPPLAMRVGIYTGPMVVGSLGSKERLEYAVIGDSVNTASRLEGFAKDAFIPDYETNPCRIFVGGPTKDYLTADFLVERIGEADLKGKGKPITVFRIDGLRSSDPATRIVPECNVALNQTAAEE
jgi:adenylate cyclase